MKRAFFLIASLAAASFAAAQTNSTSTAPAAQTQTGTQQTAPAASSTPATGNTVPNSPQPAHTKGAPQAKTQEEFKAYQDVVAKTDTTQMEQAADTFAQKFPNSDLRVVLYNALMNTYRNGGATDRAIAVGRKAIAIDPTDPVPNVMVALSLAQTTRDTDLDKDDRLNEATKDAQRAIDNVDTGMAIPPNTPPEKVQAAKNSITQMAYETEGTVAMLEKDFPAAEAAFRKGLEVNKAEPDGVLYLRLAIALDNQKKYPEAMEATENAIKYNQAGSEAQNLANQEKVRLQKLTGSTAPATTPAPTVQ
jgi:tetratricopeptide (TPR) repeat protein